MKILSLSTQPHTEWKSEIAGILFEKGKKKKRKNTKKTKAP